MSRLHRLPAHKQREMDEKKAMKVQLQAKAAKDLRRRQNDKVAEIKKKKAATARVPRCRYSRTIDCLGRPMAIAPQMEQVLGQGGQGTVHKAVDLEIGQVVAVKRVDLLSPSSVDEACIHRSLQHNNIIQYHGYFVDGNEFQLAMEMAQGDLFMFSQETSSMSLEERASLACGILQQVASAILYLHGIGIVHGDIKRENVLFVDGVAKLADFGLSSRLSKDGFSPRQAVGTPGYMAPELLLGLDYGRAVDIYAFGVMAFKLIVGQLPCKTPEAQIAGRFSYPARLRCSNKALNQALNELCLRCLDPRPTSRATIAEVPHLVRKIYHAAHSGR